jgi:hypothetical protein
MTENVKHVESKFADWLASQMPPNTVISDAGWWAPRILREIERLQREAAGDGEAVALIAPNDLARLKGGCSDVPVFNVRPPVSGFIPLYTAPRPTGTDDGTDAEAAKRYIRDWCPDHVKDYVASLTTPASAEPGEEIVRRRMAEADDLAKGGEFAQGKAAGIRAVLADFTTEARGGGEAVPYCYEVKWADGVTTYPKYLPVITGNAQVTPLFVHPAPAAPDAARYRWLRENFEFSFHRATCDYLVIAGELKFPSALRNENGDVPTLAMDAVIDAARATTGASE